MYNVHYKGKINFCKKHRTRLKIFGDRAFANVPPSPGSGIAWLHLCAKQLILKLSEDYLKLISSMIDFCVAPLNARG